MELVAMLLVALVEAVAGVELGVLALVPWVEEGNQVGQGVEEEVLGYESMPRLLVAAGE